MVRIHCEIPFRRRRYSLAGFLAQHFGPVIGGLFLAFPAIFPASATLVEKLERTKKQNAGIKSTIRGRQAAALDAYGAAMGCLGLMCFAGIVWKLIPGHNPSMVLFAATAAWFGVSIWIWLFRKSRLPQSLTLFLPACLHSSLNAPTSLMRSAHIENSILLAAECVIIHEELL